MKSKSLFLEFQQHSTDFLRILGEKSRHAERSKSAAEELATLEFFWDGVEAIFQKYEAEIHSLRLQCVNEHAKAILLTNELKATYNELYKVRTKIPDTLAKLMATTKLPTREDLQQDVNIKNNPDNGAKN